MADLIKSKKAFYVDRMPPCNNACPAGENIQLWLSLVVAERYYDAWKVIMQNNPLPAIHGRVCYHPCEKFCNRQGIDESVSIHAVERFLGDMAIEEGWNVPLVNELTKKRVLVVGAGPAGLSAAYHLRLFGHDVTIFDDQPKAGGMMCMGIPRYRLPSEILLGEIKRLEDLGVNIILNHQVKDLMFEKQQGNFAAVFLAVGAHHGRMLEYPQKDPCTTIEAISFLKAVEMQTITNLNGKNVVIYGGGNTAADVARTARRLGAKEISVVYRREREKMVIFDFEMEESLEENVKFLFSHVLTSVEKNAINFNFQDKAVSLNADMLILAVGQISGTDFLRAIPGIEFKSDKTVVVDEHMMTGCEGIFAGGDMVPYDRSVTIAVGHGKKAARNINAYLHNTTYVKPPKHEIARFGLMNVWYEEKSPKTKQNILPTEIREKSFVEVTEPLSDEQVAYESKRCLSCGNCNECDGCYAVCPERAICKLGEGERYAIDENLCTGCEACKNQCPVAAIKMLDKV